MVCTISSREPIHSRTITSLRRTVSPRDLQRLDASRGLRVDGYHAATQLRYVALGRFGHRQAARDHLRALRAGTTRVPRLTAPPPP